MDQPVKAEKPEADRAVPESSDLDAGTPKGNDQGGSDRTPATGTFPAWGMKDV